METVSEQKANSNASEELGKKYAVIDKDGKVICIEDGKAVPKEIKYVNKNNIFVFWNCDVENLKSFIQDFNYFKNDAFSKVSLDDISFLEVKESENGEIELF